MATPQDPTELNPPKLDIMVDQMLTSSFNPRIWQLISNKSPQEFIAHQQDLLNILLSDTKLFDSFFYKFYSNHLHLNDWYLLANYNQIDIKKYVFTRLLTKKYKEYRQIVKNEQLEICCKKSNEVFRQKEEVRKQRKKESFHKMYLSNAKKSTIIKNTSKEKEETRQSNQKCDVIDKEVEKQDYHQLFLKTFSACDGSKYIYYDFNKHMSGVSNKKKYNQFIRVKKHKRNNSNDLYFNFTSDFNSCAIKKIEQCLKTSPNSFYRKQNTEYLHEKEEETSDKKYCNFQMDPIGEVKNRKYSREFILLRRTMGGLKKVKVEGEKSKFQLKKRKIL